MAGLVSMPLFTVPDHYVSFESASKVTQACCIQELMAVDSTQSALLKLLIISGGNTSQKFLSSGNGEHSSDSLSPFLAKTRKWYVGMLNLRKSDS